MLSRRKFFSLLPLSALGLAAHVKAEPAPEKKVEEPSMWVEIACQRRAHYDWRERYSLNPKTPNLKVWVRGKMLAPACGQKFKALRVAITPICPKCGYSQDISKLGVREKFMGIPC
jgi:hypothetical protein